MLIEDCMQELKIGLARLSRLARLGLDCTLPAHHRCPPAAQGRPHSAAVPRSALPPGLPEMAHGRAALLIRQGQ